jgi:hypothetical protein
MSFFSDGAKSPYSPGDLFIGRTKSGRDVGISTERHAITIAGSGSGKGAALIIPNLQRWPHNVLVIDPKGENAEKTWQDRQAKGQQVVVLDPFKTADVPDELRGSCNLLADIDLHDDNAREDIRVIADGLVMRYRADHGMWDSGAVTVLAGFIAFVLAVGNPNEKTLPAVRKLMTSTPDDLKDIFSIMAGTVDPTGLCQAAAAIGLSDSKKNKEYVGGAIDNTDWLDSAPMRRLLAESSFSLSDLKSGKTSLFLVLPPKYLTEHGRFLRLFVRTALNAMTQDGQSGEKCLFILDEFFALGTIDQIETAAGLMRSYGVQLWPFLQNISQLVKLYSKEGAEAFFANSDAHIFFGNSDVETLHHISARLGIVEPHEIGSPPMGAGGGGANLMAAMAPRRRGSVDSTGLFLGMIQSMDQSSAAYRHATYQQKQMTVGKPRLAPDAAQKLIAKKSAKDVARSMIVFTTGHGVLNLELAPYFNAAPRTQSTKKDSGFNYRKPLFWLSLFYGPAVSGVLLTAALPEIGFSGVVLSYAGAAYWLLRTKSGQQFRDWRRA